MAAIAAATACGTNDPRPASVEYITEAVLVPSCAVAQCHSSFKQEAGYSFATIDEARDSLAGIVSVVDVDVDGHDIGDPDASLLVEVLVRKDDRMPSDQPLPDADIELIRSWVSIGAPGAQCLPQLGAEQCINDRLYRCGSDHSFADLVEDCTLRAPTGIDRCPVCRSNACVEVAKDPVLGCPRAQP